MKIIAVKMLHRYCRGHGFDSRSSLNFFRFLLFNCLSLKHRHCDDLHIILNWHCKNFLQWGTLMPLIFKFYPRNIYTTFVNSKPSEIKNVLYPLGEMILHLNFHFFTHCLMFKESDPPSWHCVPTSVIHHFQGPRKSSIYHCWKESCSIRSWKHLSLSLG